MVRRLWRSKRSKIIVDQQFQFKYSAFLVLVAAVPTILLVIVVHFGISSAIHMEHATHFSESVAVDVATKNEIRWVAGWFFAFVPVYLLALFCVGLFVTHRIAGPIVAIRRDLKAMIRKNDYKPIVIRKRDEFHRLKEDINKFVNHMIVVKTSKPPVRKPKKAS